MSDKNVETFRRVIEAFNSEGLDRLPRAGAHGRRVVAEPLQDRDDDALVLLEQRGEQVRRGDLGVGVLGGEPLGGGHRLLRLDGEAIRLHASMVPAIASNVKKSKS